MNIILCSASERRRKLVCRLGAPYTVFRPDVDENLPVKDPVKLVKKLALSKALAGARRFSGGIALGVDTIVVFRGEIIGKPASPADAHRILKKLNGSVHRVYSGFALLDCKSGRAVTDCEVTRVKLRRLPAERIKELSTRHLDKAGAYAVQEKSDAFVEKIYGDYNNVVGFPVKKISKRLSEVFGEYFDFKR